MEEKIKELIDSKKFRELKNLLSEEQVVDIAESIKDLEID